MYALLCRVITRKAHYVSASLYRDLYVVPACQGPDQGLEIAFYLYATASALCNSYSRPPSLFRTISLSYPGLLQNSRGYKLPSVSLRSAKLLQMFRRRSQLARFHAIPCYPHQRFAKFLCSDARRTRLIPENTDIQELSTLCIVVRVKPDGKDNVRHARPVHRPSSNTPCHKFKKAHQMPS